MSNDIVIAATEPRLKKLQASKASVAVVANERCASNECNTGHSDKLQQVKNELKAELADAQDMRISAIESAVEDLKSSAVYQQNQTVAVQKELAGVQQQIGGLPDQIAKLCAQLQHDSEGRIKELANDFKSSLFERDNKSNSQFEELKNMIDSATSAKARRVAGELRPCST